MQKVPISNLNCANSANFIFYKSWRYVGCMVSRRQHFLGILNLKGYNKSHHWFIIHSDLPERVDFAYWWSLVGKVCAQPAKHAGSLVLLLPQNWISTIQPLKKNCIKGFFFNVSVNWKFRLSLAKCIVSWPKSSWSITEVQQMME